MLEGLFAYLIALGPIGLFFGGIISHATIFLPMPLDFAIIPLATIDFFGLGPLTPLLLGIIVSIGSAIGELTSYFLGSAGIKTFESMKRKEVDALRILKERLEKSGVWFIALLAFLPIPFDLVGIAAGLAKYSKKKFLMGFLIGKTPRFVALAYAGYFGLPWLLKFFGMG